MNCIKKILKEEEKLFEDAFYNEVVETFHKFKPDKSKCPSSKKLGKRQIFRYADLDFEFSKEDGLRLKKTSKNDSDCLICNCIPYVVQKIYSFNTKDERESQLVWSVHTKGAKELRSCIYDITSDKYLSSHLPHNVIVKSPRHLQYFLQGQSTYAPIVNLYNYTGFIPGKYEYVHSGGIISEKYNCKSCSWLPNGNKKTLIQYNVSPKKIKKILGDIIRLNPVLTIMLSYNVLSLTYSLYKNKRPQFVLTIYGESGTFKTTICMYIFEIFKEFYDQAPINLKIATLSSIHNNLTQFRDCVVLNDDGAPSVDGNDEMCKKIESISRAYGDSTGRTVMKGVTTIHNTTPVGLSAITAEFQPFRDTSDMARSVMFELNKGDIDEKLLSEIQNNKPAYIRFITDYIGWICLRGDDYMKDIEDFFNEGRKKYDDLKSIHYRLPDNFGWLYAGFKMFLQFMSDRYDLNAKTRKTWFEAFEKATKRAIKCQKEAMHTVDDAKLFVSTVSKLLKTGQANLAAICTGENKKKIATVSPRTIGYYDENFLYLLPDEAYGITNKWLHSMGSGYSLPKESLESKLVNAGVVIKSEKNRIKSKLTINGSRQQVLKCKKKFFM